MKQKFYVVAHNPNTVREAVEFLEAGVNGLGPDIKYENGQFYVSHGGFGSHSLKEEFTLERYLRGLRQYIIDSGNLNLALLIFDIKDPQFDINVFFDVVYQHFARFPICNDVALMATVSDIKNADFLLRYKGALSNAGIGIDQHSNPYEVQEKLQGALTTNIAYGNGITTMLEKPRLFFSISEAKYLQSVGGFKMIFTWVLAREAAMRSFLHLLPDAILVDLPDVATILDILKEPEFESGIELAKNGHNPWHVSSIPAYSLTIKTSDKIFWGTDVSILFRLRGKLGTLHNTIDASFDNMMERGGLNHVVLQGENIGEVTSLSLELLNSGLNTAWLPEFIEARDPLGNTIHFAFDKNEWLKPGHSIIKSNPLALS